jgi:hypothetical protein
MAAIRSGRSGLDANHPPDTPIILGELPTESASLVTVEVQRELEASLRESEKIAMQVGAYRSAEHDATVAVGLQAMWFTCGLFVARRGYRYADPIRSLVKPYTDNVVICKAANPFSVIGGLMASVTAFQIPSDVGFWLSARRAAADEAAKLEATQLRQRTLASLTVKVPRPFD